MEKNSGPKLLLLEVRGAELDAEFNPEIEEYWGTVPFDVNSVAISAEAPAGCALKCNGVSFESGQEHNVILAVGRNDIEVSVTDSNG